MTTSDIRSLYLSQDATGLADCVAAKDVTPGEFLEVALELTEERNPAMNAVVLTQPKVAQSLIADGLPPGPFQGVPFLLKDLGAEARGFPTNNGSCLSAGTRWTYDSEIYTRLRAAGLVTFGRTASPELGVGPVTEAKVYGGPTRNPWDLSRTSGGSSGGAGSAVAAGIVPAAHGSDGGGSVRIPAAACGLVGFKPTRARLPKGPGTGEGWAGMAIDGFLTRSLRDTAGLLDCVDGPAHGAPYFPPPMEISFAEAATRDPARLRVRVLTTTLTGDPVHPDCAKAVRDAARLLEDFGHDVEEIIPVRDLGLPAMMHAWTNIVACGTALAIRKMTRGQPVDPAKIEGVTRGALTLAATLDGADYLDAVQDIHAFGRRMALWFEGFDVLLSPTLAAPPIEIGRLKPDNEDFTEYRNGPDGAFAYSPFTAAFNSSGQPAVSLPLGHNDQDLPIGVHLAMGFGADAALMSLCGQIERAAPWAQRQQRLIDRL